jgi:hypothetical protein
VSWLKQVSDPLGILKDLPPSLRVETELKNGAWKVLMASSVYSFGQYSATHEDLSEAVTDVLSQCITAMRRRCDALSQQAEQLEKLGEWFTEITGESIPTQKMKDHLASVDVMIHDLEVVDASVD